MCASEAADAHSACDEIDIALHRQFEELTESAAFKELKQGVNVIDVDDNEEVFPHKEFDTVKSESHDINNQAPHTPPLNTSAVTIEHVEAVEPIMLMPMTAGKINIFEHSSVVADDESTGSLYADQDLDIIIYEIKWSQ